MSRTFWRRFNCMSCGQYCGQVRWILIYQWNVSFYEFCFSFAFLFIWVLYPTKSGIYDILTLSLKTVILSFHSNLFKSLSGTTFRFSENFGDIVVNNFFRVWEQDPIVFSWFRTEQIFSKGEIFFSSDFIFSAMTPVSYPVF